MVKKQQHIGRYVIIRRLGKGGMGIVYKALTPVIDKVVAVKVLDPTEVLELTVGTDRLEEIFTAEAKTLARLHHPHITAIWDFDRDGADRPFLVMEYYCNNLGAMIGESFELEKPSRQIRPDKVLHYGVQLLEALEYLHYNHIVHRDIKPHNILVTDSDTVKVCDFGMALVDGMSFSGPVNMQVGSPCYTPPEQKQAPNRVDGRADCYSAAVLFYRMLTGTLPGMQSFPLSQINPTYDHNWDRFFHTGLSWNPDERFQSAREMKNALKMLRVHGQRQETSLPAGKPAAEPSRRPRSTPDNQCGVRALTKFGLTELQRPRVYSASAFERRGALVADHSSGLLWQQAGSPYPLTWQDGNDYVAHLNRTGAAGIRSWRLPTLDELMTLLDGRTTRQDTAVFAADRKWLWSCDLHGRTERWFANLDMGYAAVQDMDCLNHVRAVSTMAPEGA